MKRTLQQTLDYAEECMDGALKSRTTAEWYQRQSEVASALARALAMASVIKYKPAATEEVDLSE